MSDNMSTGDIPTEGRDTFTLIRALIRMDNSSITEEAVREQLEKISQREDKNYVTEENIRAIITGETGEPVE